MEELVFGWVDYSLFGGLISISLLIGIYFGFFSKQNSASEYLFGGKTMSYFPVAVSILASFLSGITYLGVPTEVYLHGSQYFAAVFATFIISIFCSYVSMPIFYKLQVSGCYEYLELRFSKNTRTFASTLYIISMFMYIPIVVYVPALAFSQVTGYSVHVVTPIFSLVCIIYTSMGGVKAVVWTDTIQFIFTMIGLVTVLILGVQSIGGITEVWKIADKGGRIKFFDLDPSPFKRDTFWAMTVGMTFTMLIRFGLGQKFIQRFLAIEKQPDMKKAIFLVSIGWSIIHIGCVITGLIMYARYHDCDPLKAKLINRSDQTLPYFVMDVAKNISGLPGIFLAGLVSSALSTMSASLNTLSGIIYDTFIDRWIPESPKKDARAANIMKFVCLVIGIITIALIFIVERLGTVFELAMGLTSATEGSLLGLLLLGILFPWVGKTGAITGASISLVIMGWYIGQTQWYILNNQIRTTSLPTSIENCSFVINSTMVDFTAVSPPTEDKPMAIFHIAVLYLTLIGGFIVIITGGITSYFVGETDVTKVNPDHVASFLRWVFRKTNVYAEVSHEDDWRKNLRAKDETIELEVKR